MRKSCYGLSCVAALLALGVALTYNAPPGVRIGGEAAKDILGGDCPGWVQNVSGACNQNAPELCIGSPGAPVFCSSYTCAANCTPQAQYVSVNVGAMYWGNQAYDNNVKCTNVPWPQCQWAYYILGGFYCWCNGGNTTTWFCAPRPFVLTGCGT